MMKVGIFGGKGKESRSEAEPCYEQRVNHPGSSA